MLIAIALGRTGLWTCTAIAGSNVTAHVTEKTETPTRSGTSYTIQYTFAIGGAEVTDTVDVNFQTHSQLSVGAAIPVRTLAFLPQWSHWPVVADYSPFWRTVMWWPIAAFWNGILSVFVWHLYVIPFRHRRLVRQGIVTIGVVTRVESLATQKVRTFGKYRIHYTYTATHMNDATTLKGTAVEFRRGEPTFKEGNELTVLYSKRRPRRSVPYHLAMYECAS
ncbi:MAG: DUF3592 domain-containing protein [Phycisphaeraceae bacterium]